MDLLYYCSLLMCFIFYGMNASSVLSVDDDQDMADVRQRAKYHLKELQKSMALISSKHKRALRVKRDERIERHETGKHDFLFHSIVHFCTEITNFNDKSSQNISLYSQNNVSKHAPSLSNATGAHGMDDHENWIKPAVFPLQITAVKHDAKRRLVLSFDISQSSAGIVSRTAGFDMETIDLPLTSRRNVTFDIDVSSYCQDEEHTLKNNFYFTSKDKPGDSVRLTVDVCTYDQFQNETLPWDVRKWETKKGPIDEDVHLVNSRIDSNISDTVIVVPGTNASFDFTVEMNLETYVNIHAIFYDRKDKIMLQDGYVYYLNQGLVHAKILPRLLSVEILNTSVVYNATVTGDTTLNPSRNDIRKRTSLRVILFTETGQRTGKLNINIAQRCGAFYNRTLVDYLHTTHEIKVRKANKKNVFPRGKVIITKQGPNLCDKEGNIRHDKLGKNCTVLCSAVGRDIRNISIAKKGTINVPIYRSITQVTGDHIYSMIDVGAASETIEGSYVCTIKGPKGFTKTWEEQLFTSGFPKIDVNHTSVTDLGNGTSVVKCTADGKLPLNITILIGVDEEEIPLSSRNNTSELIETETEQGMTQIYEIATDELRFPSRRVACQVSGVRGNDYHSIYLGDVIQNYRGQRVIYKLNSFIR